ncbi:MAG: hypothetical protein Q9211_006729 [Gyalolechia sp. 1 TL-2023]
MWIFTIRKKNPLETVAEMTPLVIGGLFATASVGIFIMMVPAHFIFGVAMFSFFLGCLLMSLAQYSKSYWAFIGPACLLVVRGPDLSSASSNIIISNAVLPEEQGVAGSFISTVVWFSVAQGLGFAATVETAVSTKTIRTLSSGIVARIGSVWDLRFLYDRVDGTKGKADTSHNIEQ